MHFLRYQHTKRDRKDVCAERCENIIFLFISSKCDKNMLKLRRKPITTRWSGRYEKRK